MVKAFSYADLGILCTGIECKKERNSATGKDLMLETQGVAGLRHSGVLRKKFGGVDMGNLGTIGIFFAGFFGGLGIFFAGCGFLWWCSLYKKINLQKQKKNT